jgi:hypothetical protein
LVEVRLAINCTQGASISVQIQGLTSAGVPNGTVLSSVTLAPGPMPTDGSLRGIQLTTPVSQAIGTQFAIVAQGPTTDACGIFFGPSTGSYPGGPLFVDVLPDSGWAENSGYLVFQTVVSP